MQPADALRAGRRKVARDEPAHARALRGAHEVLLLRDREVVHSADDDVRACERAREHLLAVVEVPDADLDARGAERGDFGLGRGRGAGEGGEALKGWHVGISWDERSSHARSCLTAGDLPLCSAL